MKFIFFYFIRSTSADHKEFFHIIHSQVNVEMLKHEFGFAER